MISASIYSNGSGEGDPLWHSESVPARGVSNPLWCSKDEINVDDPLLLEVSSDESSASNTTENDSSWCSNEDASAIKALLAADANDIRSKQQCSKADAFLINELLAADVDYARKKQQIKARQNGSSRQCAEANLIIGILVFCAIYFYFHKSADTATTNDICAGLGINTTLATPSFLDDISDHPLCDTQFEEQCSCQDPRLPIHPQDDTTTASFERNKAIAESCTDPLDVVFIGESITDHVGFSHDGRDIGENEELVMHEEDVFMNDDIQGLSLGIGGDRFGNLLYRLQHGELPDNLNSKIWWIMVGTNDLTVDHCSKELTLAGTLRVIEEFQQRRPNTQIVLNSIIPRIVGDDQQATQIKDVNKHLECYASQRDGIHFFDASPIFESSLPSSPPQPSIDTTSNSLRGNSIRDTTQGKWREAVAQKIKELLRA